MLLYSNTISNRLTYIVSFLAKESGAGQISITRDKDEYSTFSGPKINYSEVKIAENEFWVKPHTLLFEKGVKRQIVEPFNLNGYRAFFKTKGDFQFDIFAASFYLLSRYEEYLPHTKDVYGRFAHENSLAFKEGFLQLPLINLWISGFKTALQQKFSSFIFRNPVFSFLPTYDIDEAFAYKYKSKKRILGASLRDLLNGNFKQFRIRRKVLANKLVDPYDAYKWMNEMHDRYKLKPYYFFLVPGKTGRFDKGILPDREELRQLIKCHAEKYTVGIHPSWQSGDGPELIKKEIATLENITGKNVTISRQHYIRFTLPETYQYLLNAGIKEDYSMGYGSINGFRASVASAFYWYNLKIENSTDLLIHPFCFMEANSYYEQKSSAQQALEELRFYYNEIKKVNGEFITIWHNSFLGTAGRFRDWKEIYEQFIKEVTA